MKFHKSDVIIAGMSLILTFLTLRLLFSENKAKAGQELMSLTVSNQRQELESSPKYVSMYPDLYVESISDFMYPDGEEKVAFLTFDDGPSSYTHEVLDILKKEGIKATFFVVGNSMSEDRIECMKRIIEEGHAIGLHTYSHEYKQIYKSVESFLEDINKLNDFLYEELRIKPNIYRFPGGSYTVYNKHIRAELIEEMKRRGYVYYDWNTSAEDSIGNPTKSSIMKNIRKDAFRFQTPVILMHDSEINSLTVQLLPEIIKEIKEKGYTFDTVDKRAPIQF